MRIAILSDIHDNIWRLETLLAGLEADALIFCGDFCAPFTLAQIGEGFDGPVHVTLHGQFCELELDGRRVAVTHYPEIGKALAQGGGYDLVCHGHSHERVIKKQAKTLRVNPGEVMGRLGPSTYALYDTDSGEASFVEVPA
jgi:predicted phosphodiesterase